ncbi:MAG: alanine racemase [Acidobacteriaceae bacterium]
MVARVVGLKVWVEVSEERLAGNLRAVREAAGAETEVLAVVKANAYGHGLERCSVGLARARARWFGVTCVSEGARVRAALAGLGACDSRGGGVGVEILVMCGFLPEDVAAMVEHGLTPVVWTEEQVGWLDGCAGMRVHVEVDTGMGRQGVRPGVELEGMLDAQAGAGLVVDGVFTHLCESEVAGSALTREQERRFEGAVGQVRARGLAPGWVHAGNSSFVDNPVGDDPAHGSPWLVELAKSVGARVMVRSGLALYGYCLPIELGLLAGGDAGAARVRDALRPVMTWKTRVLAVRELNEGETVGYGATFVAPGAMRVALLPVGYADGLRRELSGSNVGSDAREGGWVMVRGRDGVARRAGIVGRVSMNLTVVDVTGAGGGVGDEVVLLGDGVTAEDHARLAGTIPYEILCGVRER